MKAPFDKCNSTPSSSSSTVKCHHVRSIRPRAVRSQYHAPSPTSSPILTPQPNRQNNSRLSELSSKVSALRGVTVDIYDNTRDQHVIDNSVRRPLPFSIPHLPTTRPSANRILHLYIVRSFLLNDNLNKRVRRSTGPDGAAGEQSRYIQTRWDYYWRGGGVVVGVELFVPIEEGLMEG